MSWKEKLFKPKWQHKNPDIRLKAVSSERHPRLTELLPEIALTDEDSRVRLAALKRLSQLNQIQAVLDQEQDKKILEVAAQRLRQLASSTDDKRPSLMERIGTVARNSDRALLEQVASHAPEAELRQAALRKVTRQGFLGDRAITDPDGETRKLAASRITQQSTLERVIKELRTRDKQLFLALTEQLHQKQLKARKPEAVEVEAIRLCEQLEAFSIKPPEDIDQAVDGIKTAWASLNDQVSEQLQNRFDHLCEVLMSPAAEQPADDEKSVGQMKLLISDLESLSDVEDVQQLASRLSSNQQRAQQLSIQEVDSELADKHQERYQTVVKRLEELTANQPPSVHLKKASEHIARHAGKTPTRKKLNQLISSWQKQWTGIQDPNPQEQLLNTRTSQVLTELEAAVQNQEQQEGKLFERAENLLANLGEKLEDGELTESLTIRGELLGLGKQLSANKQWAALRGQLSGLQLKLRELRDWQHWANNKIRKRMIEEIEALPIAELHPDAVLQTIRKAQKEWKALEQSEQIPGDKHFATPPWMWRKFNGVCHQAYEIAKPYFEKKSEIQQRHEDEINTFVEQMRTANQSDNKDWPALQKNLFKARKTLRSLGEIPAKSRQAVAKQLKQVMDETQSLLNGHYEVVEKEKIKLIRAAEQLTHVHDRDEAIAQAKSLQAKWKNVGSLWRSKEQKLWLQFRAPMDPLFEALKADAKEQKAAQQAEVQEQKALCQELEELLKLDINELSAQSGKVQGLDDQWHQIKRPLKHLQNRFSQNLEAYQKKLRQLEQQTRNLSRQRWQEKASLLHQLESAIADGKADDKLYAKLGKQWPGDENTGEELDHSLDQRFTRLQENKSLPEDDVEQTIETARLLCIQLEFLSGLASPEEEKETRMRYQVERLSNTLTRSGQQISSTEEGMQVEQLWFQLGYLPVAYYKPFKARIDAALKELLKE